MVGEFSFSKLFLHLGVAKTPMFIASLTLLLIGAAFLHSLRKDKSSISTSLMIVIVLCVVQMSILHLAFDVLYPVKRGTIFMQYLILLIAVTLIQQITARIALGITTIMSLVFIVWTSLDLIRPSLCKVLVKTSEAPLYHVGYNPSLILTRTQSNLPTEIIQKYTMSETLAEIEKNEANIVYLLVPDRLSDSIPEDSKKVMSARNMYSVYMYKK